MRHEPVTKPPEELDAFVPLSEEHQRQIARFTRSPFVPLTADEQKAIRGWVGFKRRLSRLRAEAGEQ